MKFNCQVLMHGQGYRLAKNLTVSFMPTPARNGLGDSSLTRDWIFVNDTKGELTWLQYFNKQRHIEI